MTDKIKGIGGWMIIPIIALVIGIPTRLIGLYINIVENYYLLSLVDIIFIGLSVYTLKLIFDRKKKSPGHIITSLWIMWFSSLIETYVLKDYSAMIGFFLFTLLWSEYFRRSKRVENTFVK